jgi:hypothetical protein
MSETTATRRRRTVERRIQGVIVIYFSEELNTKGERVEISKVARQGQLVTLSARECARLDALGVLAPAGATVEDLQANTEAVYEEYRNARQSVAGMPEGY